MDDSTGAFPWKIQKIIKKGDYIYAKVPDHPNASTKGGYVLEHRVVMENHLKRLLSPSEVVHHKNGDRHDNRIENLEVMQMRDHSKMHASTGRAWAYHNKPGKWNACSPHCRGKFSRMIQLYGITEEVEKAISGNTVRHYCVHDNPEETVA